MTYKKKTQRTLRKDKDDKIIFYPPGRDFMDEKTIATVRDA
jgi:hypothetical protein